MIIIIGGVITIEGAILFFWLKPSISGKIVIIGAILAGVNIISLVGGIKIIKLAPKTKNYTRKHQVPPLS